MSENEKQEEVLKVVQDDVAKDVKEIPISLSDGSKGMQVGNRVFKSIGNGLYTEIGVVNDAGEVEKGPYAG